MPHFGDYLAVAAPRHVVRSVFLFLPFLVSSSPLPSACAPVIQLKFSPICSGPTPVQPNEEAIPQTHVRPENVSRWGVIIASNLHVWSSLARGFYWNNLQLPPGQRNATTSKLNHHLLWGFVDTWLQLLDWSFISKQASGAPRPAVSSWHITPPSPFATTSCPRASCYARRSRLVAAQCCMSPPLCDLATPDFSILRTGEARWNVILLESITKEPSPFDPSGTVGLAAGREENDGSFSRQEEARFPERMVVDLAVVMLKLITMVRNSFWKLTSCDS